MKLKLVVLLTIVLCLWCVPGSASTLNFTGTVLVNATTIDWYPPVGPPDGLFTVTGPGSQSGVFVPLANTDGHILDLTSAGEPVNTPLNVPNFITFVAAPNLTFTLTRVNQGATIPGSPFTLTSVPGGNVLIGMSVQADLVDTNTGMVMPYSGVFSTQLTRTTVADVLATINAGGTINSSYSATFSNVPEPFSMSLVGLGLVGLGMFSKRLRRSA